MSSVKTHRKQYQRITFAKRLKLIELVVEKRLSICRAAVATEIALSTAKIIIKRFREKGTIFVRKEEQKLSKKSEEMSQIFEANESQQALVENPGSNGQNIPFMPYLTYIPPVETFLVFYSPEIFFDSAFSGFARLQ